MPDLHAVRTRVESTATVALESFVVSELVVNLVPTIDSEDRHQALGSTVAGSMCN